MSADDGNGWRERAHLFLRVTHIARSSVSCPVWAGKSKVPKWDKSMRTKETQWLTAGFVHFGFVSVRLLFACVCAYYCNTPAIKGLSLILWVSVGGLLKFPTFTVSVWGCFLSGGLDMISTNQCLSMKHQCSPHFWTTCVRMSQRKPLLTSSPLKPLLLPILLLYS